MTHLAVQRTATAVLVGSLPAHPSRTALIEARGALLLWDLLAPGPHPTAFIHDPFRAADWLWEIYGLDAANALLADTETIELPAEPPSTPVLTSARRLAHLHWAASWWPSSLAAAVPPLSPGLLRAETTWRTAAVEHLLDDEHAVERVLATIELSVITAAESQVPTDLAAELRTLSSALLDLAEDHGLTLSERARLRPEDFALAAGGTAPGGLTVATGSDPVDWTLLPHGLVDAASEASWTLTLRAGTPILTVAVPAAPEALHAPDLLGPPDASDPPPAPDAPHPALIARVGGLRIDLRLDPATAAFTGETQAPQSFLLTPAAERTTSVHAPGFALPPETPDPEAPTRQAAIIAAALQRLDSPGASLTERVAARSRA